MTTREEDESMDYDQYLQQKAQQRQENGLSLTGVNAEDYDPHGEGHVEENGKDGLTMSERAHKRQENPRPRRKFARGDNFKAWRQQGFGGTRRLRSSKTSQGGRKGKSSKRKHAKKSRSSRRRR